MKKIFVISLLLMIVNISLAQEIRQYKKDVKVLSSKRFDGRGYYNDGMNKAADYLASRFKEIGLSEVGGSYFQEFQYDVNIYPGNAEIKIDGRKLVPGVQWVMREFSHGDNGTFEISYIDTVNFDGRKLMSDINDGAYDDKYLVIDWDFYRKNYKDLRGFTSSRVRGIICRWSTPLKFYKAYSDNVVPPVIVWVNKDFPDDARQITINVDSEFIKDYKVRNVVGMIEGARYKDSVFMVTAHYDHLGHLGRRLYYPGANDNASGTAMLLNLATYFAKNRPDCTILFVAFAGEEAGLRGSVHYSENPLVPLENVRYLVNLDMVGDNGDNLYVETNSFGERGLHLFDSINKEKKYFNSIERGELAGNSDHAPFAYKNVPALLMMFEEGDAFPYYHTHNDNTETMRYDSFEKIFDMVKIFINNY
ncbi:MAG: M28 family metallopeptidase [Candidatus Limimorpha sp.]